MTVLKLLESKASLSDEFHTIFFQFKHIRIADEKRNKTRSTYMKVDTHLRSPPQEYLV
jgi:hypothetical protein